LALEYALILAVDLGHLPKPIPINLCAEIAAIRKLLLSALTDLADRELTPPGCS
jgi:hypothetical protein